MIQIKRRHYDAVKDNAGIQGSLSYITGHALVTLWCASVSLPPGTTLLPPLQYIFIVVVSYVSYDPTSAMKGNTEKTYSTMKRERSFWSQIWFGSWFSVLCSSFNIPTFFFLICKMNVMIVVLRKKN